MDICDFLRLEDIHLDVPASSKREVFEFLVGYLKQRRPDVAVECRRGLLAREDLGTTAIGRGCAFPHAFVEELLQPITVFLRLEKAIEYDAPDNEPVDLVIMVLMPKDAIAEHLKLLSTLGRAIRSGDLAARLRAARTAEDAKEAFGDLAD